MTSTILDATLCLLLVGASVASVTAVDPNREAGISDHAGREDAIAETLATSTATVNHSVGSPDWRAERRPNAGLERTAHGTLAGLLADAAVAAASVDGRRLSHARVDMIRRVRRTVGAAVGTSEVQIVAVWQPVRGGRIEGRVEVGPTPPPATDISAATLRVPSGMGAPDRVSRASGIGPIATAVARRTVDGLFPPTGRRRTLQRGGPAATVTERQYRRAADLLGADLRGPLAAEDTRVANRRLHRSLAGDLNRTLRGRAGTSAEAARAVGVGEVQIVVRTWSS